MMLLFQILITNLVLVLLSLLLILLAVTVDAIFSEEFVTLISQRLFHTKELLVETGVKEKKKKCKRHLKRNHITHCAPVVINNVSIMFDANKKNNEHSQESCNSAIYWFLVCASLVSNAEQLKVELEAVRAMAASVDPTGPKSAHDFQKSGFGSVPDNLSSLGHHDHLDSTPYFPTDTLRDAHFAPIPDESKTIRASEIQNFDLGPITYAPIADPRFPSDCEAEETAPTTVVSETPSVAEKLTADKIKTAETQEDALTATVTRKTGPLPEETSTDAPITDLTFAPSGGHPSGKLSSSTEPSHALNTVNLVELEAYTGAATESGSCRASQESASGTAALLLDDELVSPGSAGDTVIAGTRVLSSAGSGDSTLCDDVVASFKAKDLDKFGGQNSSLEVFSMVVDDDFYARPRDITFRTIQNTPAQPAVKQYLDTLAGETSDDSPPATSSSCYDDVPQEIRQQNFSNTTPAGNVGPVAACWKQPWLSEEVQNAMNGVYENPYLLPSTASSSSSRSYIPEQTQEQVPPGSCTPTTILQDADSTDVSPSSGDQSLHSVPPSVYSAPMSLFGRQLTFEVTFEARTLEAVAASYLPKTEAETLPALPRSPSPSSSSSSDGDEAGTSNNSPRPPQSSDAESWSSSSSEEEDGEEHFTKRLHTLKGKLREKTQSQRDWWSGFSTEKKNKIHNKVHGRKVHFAEELEVRYFLQTDLTDKEDPCETVLRHWMPPRYGGILKGPHRISLRETVRRRVFAYFRLPDPLSEVLKEPEAENYLQQKKLFKKMYPDDSYDDYLKLKRREARQEAFDAEWKTLKKRQKLAIKLYLKHKYREGFRLFAGVAKNKAAKATKDPGSPRIPKDAKSPESPDSPDSPESVETLESLKTPET